jgi:hypothetical protein
LGKSKVKILTGNAETHTRSYSTGFLRTTSKPGAEQVQQEDPPLLHPGDNKSTIASATSSNLSNLSLSHTYHTHNNKTSSQTALDNETNDMDFIRKQLAKIGIKSKRSKERDRIKPTISEPFNLTKPAADAATRAATDADKITPLAMNPSVSGFAEAPVGVRLPNPRLPYPEQLQLTGEYPQ